jgi:hypothetical protein
MKRQFVLLLIIVFFFLFLSYVPNIYEAALTDQVPPDRTMIWGEHIYTYDYNVYLSKIRQGQEGRFSIVDKYDNNTNQKGVFLQMLYVLSGKIGALLHLNPVLSFHLLRTILSIGWVLMIIFLNIYFLKKPTYYFWGTLISLLASSYPIFYRMENQVWVTYFMNWWTEMDVLKRISYLPHYTLNYIIIAVLTILLDLYSKTGLKKYYYSIAVILFFSFFIHPAAGLLFLISWVLFFAIKFLFDRDKNKLVKIIPQTLILFGVTLIPMLYIRSITLSYPWKALTDFDQNNRIIMPIKDYLLTLGPVLITGILGATWVLVKKKIDLLGVTTWFLGAFVGIILFKFFPFQSELRFVQTANHIPLSILTVYFGFELIGNFKKSWVKKIVYGVFGLITILGIVQTIYSLKSQMLFIHQRAVATLPLVPYPSQVMHPLKDFADALVWLEKNTPRNSVVLSKITAGNYIPAYSGNFVYFGHNGETPQYNERQNNVNWFFSGQMSLEKAKSFLQETKINYIFYGPQEKDNAVENISKYDFLKPVFESYYVNVYKIINR